MKLRHFILFCALTSPAFAHLPPGVLPGPNHEWWQCMSSSKSQRSPCCDVGDGHVLSDRDWGMYGTGGADLHYQVKVNGKWFHVPDDAIISTDQCRNYPDPDPSAAVVWYGPEWGDNNTLVGLIIWCFRPGTMY